MLEVDLLPDFGRNSVARDVPGNDVVVGCGRGVLIKCGNSTSKREDLDYGRGRESCDSQEVSVRAKYLWCDPDLLWGIRSHPQRGGRGVRGHDQWRRTSDLSAVG